jgi:hypothetical protein
MAHHHGCKTRRQLQQTPVFACYNPQTFWTLTKVHADLKPRGFLEPETLPLDFM